MGEQIDVAISIDVTDVDAPDQALGGFSGYLDWDPAVVAYDGNSGILEGFSGVVNDTGASSGHLIFNGAKAAGAMGKLTVLSITFHVVGAGSSDLALDYTAMSAAYSFSNLLPLLTVYDGRVEVGAAQSYSLSIAVDPTEGGTTNPEVGVHAYPEGTAVDLTAMPNANFAFEHWSGACTGGGPCQVTMNADQAVTAIFTGLPPTCYSLTLTHTGRGSDPVADPSHSTGCPSGWYVEGEKIKLSGALPDPGWGFSGWTGTTQDSSRADTNSLTMPARAHAVGITYELYTYAATSVREAATSEPDLSQTMVAEGEAIAPTPPTPDPDALDSSPIQTATEQIPGQQDLIAASEHSNGDDSAEGISDDGPTDDDAGATGLCPCALPLFFLMAVSSCYVLKEKSMGSD